MAPVDEADLSSATEIWYKGQRVLRSLLTTALTVLPLIPQVVAIVQGQWGAEWLAPIAVQAVAINSALTAIIAIPVVNEWLTKIGLGSVPRSAVVTDPSGGVHVLADPKVVAHHAAEVTPMPDLVAAPIPVLLLPGAGIIDGAQDGDELDDVSDRAYNQACSEMIQERLLQLQAEGMTPPLLRVQYPGGLRADADLMTLVDGVIATVDEGINAVDGGGES